MRSLLLTTRSLTRGLFTFSMKNIELHKVGWATTNSINWNYYVWNCYSDSGARIQCKETFGGEYRLRELLESKGYTVKIYSGVNVGKFGFRETGKLPDIESEEVFTFLTK